MPAKGSGRQSNCGGCFDAPRMDIATAEKQLLRHFCCACIPKKVCARYECYETGVSVTDTFRVFHECDGTLPDQSVYRGSLPIGGSDVPVEVGFVIEDEACYLYLDSYDLGVSKHDRDYWIPLDEYNRHLLCRSCQTCPEIPSAPVQSWISWTLPDGCAFRIKSPDLFSLTKNPACPECCDPDSCLYDEIVAGSQHQPLDESAVHKPCCAHCLGCSCIGSCACIIIIKGGIPLDVARVCICDYSWNTASGFSIAIRANPETLACELVLASTGAYTPTSQLEAVGISDLAAPYGSCPNIAADWAFYVGEDITSDYVQVFFDSAPCGECTFIAVNCCGDEIGTGGAGQLPKVLYATVDGGADCCSVGPIPLIYDAIEGSWIGSHPNGRCGVSTRLRLTCSGSGWVLTFSGGTCIEKTAVAAYAECHPISLTFTVPTDGLGCCDPGSFLKTGVLTIEVTE